jgi:acyl-[acyl-carrier-protein]-phospholipid O-acyltransferase/long-chain-fatty-acid--[acyl-carrier-protein] ligase
MAFQPADTLGSRTYLGLLAAQFLAAFNDQAIHIVAIFYAGDMLLQYAKLPHFHEKDIITLVSGCFILPFFLFSTLAGMLADKFSKRNILVCWKMAEVAITGLVLVGFLLPHTAALGWAGPRELAIWSALIVVSGVFLMGSHSTFFIPAKYGAMPEILEHSVLSRGNGYLEATSFLATIFGTVFGAGMYGQLKTSLAPDGSLISLGHEWVLGAVLFGLAILGAVCSLLIEHMPAAAPDRRLTWKLWQPLWENVRVLLRSRPLALSVIGIAFFACLTLYARQTLLYQGEATKNYNEAYKAAQEARKAAEVRQHRQPAADEGPDADQAPEDANFTATIHPGATQSQKEELWLAILIALVGLGVGIGSPLAGLLSGKKVELGLVPIGALFLIGFTILLAFALPLQRLWLTVMTLILIGIASGFYIVPLYTLLQLRAPKDSKGNLVATSNFINVVGGLLAILLFWMFTALLETAWVRVSSPPTQDQLKLMKDQVPTILFLVASVMTAGILFLLCQQLPDFFTRALLWLRSLSRYRLHVVGINNLPSEGPVILATNCETPVGCMKVLTATDRFTRFILVEHSPSARLPWLLRYLTRRTHLGVLKPGQVNDTLQSKILADAVEVLRRGEMVGLPANGNGQGVAFDVDRFLAKLRAQIPAAQVLPVWCGPENGAAGHHGRQRIRVVMGKPVPADTPAEEIRQQIHALELTPDHPVAEHELAQGVKGLQPHGG